jgi:hypothetical protein
MINILYFVGFADNVGYALTFKILKNDLVKVLHSSVIRSSADSTHHNESVSFYSDVQGSFNYLILSQLFGKIFIISINREILIMMCQTELGLRQIIQTSMFAVELALRCTTYM